VAQPAVNFLIREIVEIRGAKSSNDPHLLPGDIGSATHDFETLVAAYRERKIRIADVDGMLAERRDTIVAPVTGPLVHLFSRRDAWAVEQRDALRGEIQTLVGL